MKLQHDYNIKDLMYYSHIRQELKPYIPNNLKKVLDVGCSKGVFGKMLKNEFFIDEVWGIEPQLESAIAATENLDKVLI